jgi:tetratricopeptide (TPR) repeat protein
MPEYRESILKLIADHQRARLRGDKETANDTLKQARELDAATLETEMARVALGRIKDDSQEAFRERCQIAARLGQVALAAPDHLETWRLLAQTLAAVSNFEGVVKATASGLKRASEDVDLWIKRVEALIALEDMQGAAKCLRECVRLAPIDVRVEDLSKRYPLCSVCFSCLSSPTAIACIKCGAAGPGVGKPSVSVKSRSLSKFDIFFPRVREVVSKTLNMAPGLAQTRITLNTLLKRDLKCSPQTCATVLNALAKEFPGQFEPEMFKQAYLGYLDLLITDIIRAIQTDSGRHPPVQL